MSVEECIAIENVKFEAYQQFRRRMAFEEGLVNGIVPGIILGAVIFYIRLAIKNKH